MIMLCRSRSRRSVPSETITTRGHGARYPAPKPAGDLRPQEQLDRMETNEEMSERGSRITIPLKSPGSDPLSTIGRALRLKRAQRCNSSRSRSRDHMAYILDDRQEQRSEKWTGSLRFFFFHLVNLSLARP